MKEYFYLDPDIIFLNHGSFGATPRPVFKVYQDWQARLEHQPVKFIAREVRHELQKTRQILGSYLNADADDLVFVPNATFGVNIIARSLPLGPADEILTTNHEYGACENTWEFVCQKNGAKFVRQPLPLPFARPDDILEQFWQGISPKTKVVFISHITSPTAMHMPVDKICKRARESGILTIIDGAHAPGQIPLDIRAINADFYIGNCHKWMLSPKGAGFLYTRRELQHLVEPLVVSWGWGENKAYIRGSKYIDTLEWWGTKDPAAYLSVPAGIKFQEEHDWLIVRNQCQSILAEGLRRINKLTGLPSAYANTAQPFIQMAIARLPPIRDLSEFQNQLYQQFKIEIPCMQWGEQQFIRISIQCYNTAADIDALVKALEKMLPHYRD